jgi:uncharacterized protein (DUF433 family)
MPESDSWRTSPIYTVPEAARLAKTSPGTIKRWMLGTETSHPIFDSERTNASDLAAVSFLQLVEIVVAIYFRRKGRVSLDVVLQAYDNARSRLEVEYPFASLRLEPLAGHIILRLRQVKQGQGFPAIDMLGLSTIPGFKIDVLDDIEYDTDFAIRWWPAGRQRPIVIDPRFSAGLPTIPQRRVTIENIRKRWLAGQTIKFISRDLDLEDKTVEDALRYGEQAAA